MLALAGFALAVGGCNTVEGAGKDVKAAGGADREGRRQGQEVLIAMEPFRILTGLVAPLDRANVDTDAIIPKQFLKSIKRSGFGPNLFDEWRYLDRGEPGHGQREAAAATRTSC